MDIEGRIILDLGIQSGTSKAGNLWKKRECVLETFGTYPRKVKFHIFGDRVDTINLEVGKDYVLSFDLESREYNGRWYTDVNVYRAAESLTGENQSSDLNYGSNLNNPTFSQQPGRSSDTSQQGLNYGSGDFSSPFGTENASDEDLPF